MKHDFWIIFVFMVILVLIALNFVYLANGVEHAMAQPQQQQQTQPQQGGLPMSQAQKMAVPMMGDQAQARPFGWLIDMIQHITGGGQPMQTPAGPVPQQGQQPAQKPADAGSAKGKQTDAGMGAGGQIDPSQVPALASILQPNAGTSALGLIPQSQGSFGWLLQMMQQNAMKQQQAQGGGLVSLVNSLVGGAPPALDLTSGQAQTAPKPAAKKG